MNNDQIRAQIQLLLQQERELRISSTTFPSSALASLLSTYYAGTDLVLSNAVLLPAEDGVPDVHVSGTSAFLHVADMPVDAIFHEAQDGIDLTLQYHLPATWKFSQSFPDLPTSLDFRAALGASQQSSLDLLTLTDASFFVSTQVYQEPHFQVAVDAGLYFVSHLTLNGLLGGIEQALSAQPELVLCGPLLFPALDQEVVQPLLPSQLPFGELQPGIHLKAVIDAMLSYSTLVLKDLSLQIYSPLTNAWFQSNPTYRPLLCFGGALQVGTQLSLAFIAEKMPGLDDALLFTGMFEGLELSSLSALADLVGADDLATYLTPPDPAPAFFSDLGKLTLESAFLAISANPFTIDVVTLTIGLQDVAWQALDGLISVGDVAVEFQVENPFNDQRSCAVMFFGQMKIDDVPFSLMAEAPDFAMETELAAAVPLPLSTLMKVYLPDVPVVSNLTVDQMYLMVLPGNSLSFSATLADTPDPWVIDLGPTPLTVSDVLLQANYSRSAGATGAFSGTLSFAGINLALVYQIPGNFILRGQFPSLSLKALVTELCGDSVPWPASFDLDLEDAFVLIQELNDHLSLNFATQVKDLGFLAVTIQHQGTWSFALGLDLMAGNLASLPGLSMLDPFEACVGLSNVMLVFSSMDQPPTFQFPDIQAFQAPVLGNNTLTLPAQASGLTRGLNLYALLQTSQNAGFRALAHYLGILLDGTLGITLALSLPDPLTNTRLFLSVSQEIQKGTTLVGEVGVLLQGSDVGAFLLATVKTQVQGQPLEFDVTAMVLEAGVLISGTMQGTIHFSSVQMSNLALVIGLDLEGIPSLGIAASLDVSTFDSALALFFDSTDPAKSLVAGALSNLTLRDIALTFAHQNDLPADLGRVLGLIGLKALNAFTVPVTVATSLDNRDVGAISAAFQQYGHSSIPATSDRILLIINQPGKIWHLTDLSTMHHYSLTMQEGGIAVALQPQLYIAPENTFIGSVQYTQGFTVTAEIDYLLLQAQIGIQVSLNQGISANIDLAPIVLLSQDFFALTGANGSGGPLFSLSTYKQPQLADPNLRDPHFLVSGMLRLLGADVAGVLMSAYENGLTLRVSGQVNPLLHVDLSGAIKGFNDLYLSGTMSVGVNNVLDLGKLGTIRVNVTVNGLLNVTYAQNTAAATFKGSFIFQQIQCLIPPLTLDARGPALRDIGTLLWAQIGDILTKMLKDPDRWLTWLHSGVIGRAGQTAEEVGKILATSYQLSTNEIASKVQTMMHYDINGVSSALKGAGSSSNDMVTALRSVGYQPDKISAIVALSFPGTHTSVNIDHTDIPPGLHFDKAPQHTDVGEVHVDNTTHADAASSHVDHTDHIDIPHVDLKVGIGTPHSDSNPHADQAITSHSDSNPHADKVVPLHGDSNIPHSDTYATPHEDTSTHVDIKA